MLRREPSSIRFGIILRELRADNDLSQDELATRAGLDRTYISLLERGQRGPTLKIMLALGKALDAVFVLENGQVEVRRKTQ